MQGRVEFSMRGPRLNRTKEQKSGVVYGPDHRLQWVVTTPMPKVVVSEGGMGEGGEGGREGGKGVGEKGEGIERVNEGRGERDMWEGGVERFGETADEWVRGTQNSDQASQFWCTTVAPRPDGHVMKLQCTVHVHVHVNPGTCI